MCVPWSPHCDELPPPPRCVHRSEAQAGVIDKTPFSGSAAPAVSSGNKTLPKTRSQPLPSLSLHPNPPHQPISACWILHRLMTCQRGLWDCKNQLRAPSCRFDGKRSSHTCSCESKVMPIECKISFWVYFYGTLENELWQWLFKVWEIYHIWYGC